VKEGIITAVKKNEVTIEILCRSACSECAQKNSCGLSDAIKKKIIIPTADASAYQTGEKVIIGISSASIALSLFFAYILPLFLLLLGIVIGTGVLNFSETLSAVVSLSIVIIYYVGLKFLNKWFQKYIKMTVRRKAVD